jgi:hypothetical protein
MARAFELSSDRPRARLVLAIIAEEDLCHPAPDLGMHSEPIWYSKVRRAKAYRLAPPAFAHSDPAGHRGSTHCEHQEFEAALAVRPSIIMALFIASCGLAGCEKKLPPLVRGATWDGKGRMYHCEPGPEPASNRRYAQSPEMAARLGSSFPAGSPSERLRRSLLQQGFELEGPCPHVLGRPLDPSVSWARFRRNGRMPVANVYWKEGADGRLIWTFGEVFTSAR